MMSIVSALTRLTLDSLINRRFTQARPGSSHRQRRSTRSGCPRLRTNSKHIDIAARVHSHSYL